MSLLAIYVAGAILFFLAGLATGLAFKGSGVFFVALVPAAALWPLTIAFASWCWYGFKRWGS